MSNEPKILIPRTEQTLEQRLAVAETHRREVMADLATAMRERDLLASKNGLYRALLVRLFSAPFVMTSNEWQERRAEIKEVLAK